ncbi:MAG: hypothetical protein IT371_00340 [Deltaproteobacteria bacterium]|nr:hypothetical protein [Deltaproteobacteria bacterium]
MTRATLRLLPFLLLGFVALPALAREPAAPAIPENDAARAALPAAAKERLIQRYGLKPVALRREFVAQHRTAYGCEIPLERRPHVVGDQQQSGRCWLFAMEHVLRSKVAARGGEPPPALSPSFLNYYALRSKGRRMLARVAVREGHPDLGYAAENLGEGGWYPLAVDLVRKYGLVPEQAMPTTRDGERSGVDSGVVLLQLKRIISAAYRDVAAINGSDRADKSRARLAVLREYEARIDEFLRTTIGVPPEEFVYKGRRYTPQSFVSQGLGLGPQDLDYVMLSSNPALEQGARYRYTVAEGATQFDVCNVAENVVRDAMVATLRRGEAICFSANVSPGNPHVVPDKNVPRGALGILSLEAFRYAPYVPEAPLARAERMRAGFAPVNHAMVITGYDPGAEPGSVRKWKVDNSWGADAGDQGHFHMYDDFFREYGGTVAVPRAMLPEAVLAQLMAEPPRNDQPVRAWTPELKEKVAVRLATEELTLSDAIRKYRLPRATLLGWKQAALEALTQALRPGAPPAPVRPAPLAARR